MDTTTKKESFSEIIRGELPVLVDFHATWCGPCKMLKPVLEQFAAKHPNSVRVIKIDVDKNPLASSTYKVQGVPTMILFHKGKTMWRQSGFMTLPQLETQLNPFIG